MAGARGIRKSPSVSSSRFKKGLPEVSEFQLGNPVCLECHVDGYPRPEVKWEKDGKAAMKSRNVHTLRSGDRCVLQIKKLGEKDLGLYKCVATNINGTAVTKTTLCLANSHSVKISNGHIPLNLNGRQNMKDEKLNTAILKPEGRHPQQNGKFSKSLRVSERLFSRSRSPSPDKCSIRNSSPVKVPLNSSAVISSSNTSLNFLTQKAPSNKCSNSSSEKSKVSENGTSNIFERLYKSQRRKKDEKDAIYKTKSDICINKSVENAEENLEQSITSRLIAKIKIPYMFNQTNNSVNINADQEKVKFHSISRTNKSCQDKTVGSNTPSSRKKDSGLLPQSSVNSTIAPSQQKNSSPSTFSNVIKEKPPKLKGLELQPEEEPPPKLNSLKLQPEEESMTPNSSKLQSEEKPPQLKSSIFYPEEEPPQLKSSIFYPEETSPKLESLKLQPEEELSKLKSLPLQSEEECRNEINESTDEPKCKDTVNVESFVIIKVGDNNSQIVSTDTKSCSQSQEVLSKSGSHVTDVQFNYEIEENQHQRIEVTEPDENKTKSDVDIKSNNVTVDFSNKIADKILTNIGISPKPSSKFIKECDELLSKYNKESTYVNGIDDCQSSKNSVESIERSCTKDSETNCTVNGHCKNTINDHKDIVPIIHIEQSINTDDKINDSTTFPNVEDYNCTHINGDVEDFCNGSIRYLSTPIEEECEDLTSSCMTPVSDINGYTSCEVKGSTDAQEKVEVDYQQVVSPLECAARIVRGPQSVTVLRGESVTLAIHFHGVPSPNVIWIKGGTTLFDGGRISIIVGKDMSVLTITKVTADDSGKYVVCVENEGGGDSCFASVAVVGFPEPPGGEPTASDFTDHSLVLSWYGSMYDGGSVVTGYVVEMCVLPDRKWQRVSSCENTSFVVRGLSCGQRYIFRVRAENKYGESAPSRESQTICLDDYLSEQYIQNEETVEIKDPVVVQVGIDFAEKYELKEVVGKGRFGTVYRCIEADTGRPRAAKVIRCIKVKDKEKVRQEVDIMNQLNHPKLLRIFAAFENGRNMIVITEYISGGELFERVIAEDFVLTESDCIAFTKQICDGVAYIHKCSIIHLDLKPENILCKTRTSHQIKIIDFGLAKIYDEKENLRILFGTPEFVAPEVINYEPVGPFSDMWSVGVICYVLLSGLSPFMGDTDSETFANITRGEVDFDDDAFLTITQDAKDFISSLLIKAPHKRLSAEGCLKHQWLKPVGSWVHSRDLPISTEKLKRFIIRRKWQKSGTAIRALGRMVSMSRSSGGSSFDSTSTSPSNGQSRSLVSSRSETSESADSEVFKDSDSVDLSR